MKKNNKGNLISSEIMKEAHAKTREFVELYQVDYQAQLGLFISCLLEEEKENQPITIEEWIEDYYSNGLYGYILHKNNILQKNGYQSHDQKAEASNTSAFYQILPEDADDIEQLALLKVVERFDREGGTIQNKARFNIWSYACLNATKEYQRNLAKFKPNSRLETNIKQGQSIAYENDSLTVTTINSIDYLKLEIELLVKNGEISNRQYKIIELKEQGYNNTEISDIVGISRQAVHKNINKIQDILKENGLAIWY